jgi:flagellar motor switch protein FliN/FliY
MKQASPLWIRHLEGVVAPLDNIPLWGHTPPFPWKKVEKALKNALELDSLHLVEDKTHVFTREQMLSSLGVDPLLIPLELTPLPGVAFWAMPKSDMEKLSGFFVSLSETGNGFESHALKEGYARFLLLKSLHILNEQQAFGDFTAHVASHTELPLEALCLDLSIQINHQKLWARLICSPELVGQLYAYVPEAPSRPLRRDLRLPLAIELGKTTVSSTTLKKLKIEDLLLLDQCSFDPESGKGTALLTAGGTPLFDLRLKEAEVKILDYAFYQEEPIMSHSSQGEETPEQQESAASETEEGQTETLIAQRHIPLTVVVEAARITLPLEKVLQLKPGNILDFKVGPQLAVTLTVGGAAVARGELVKIGESVGVRILALN